MYIVFAVLDVKAIVNSPVSTVTSFISILYLISSVSGVIEICMFAQFSAGLPSSCHCDPD